MGEREARENTGQTGVKRTPLFLTLAEVLDIQMDQIGHYGGSPGIRDMRLLESAIAMPEQSFNNIYLHKNLCEMAAAYAFHLCSNHPFIDGNKRTALAAALVFLRINGVSILDLEGKLYPTMMNVAKGSISKEQLTELFQQLKNAQQ